MTKLIIKKFYIVSISKEGITRIFAAFRDAD